MRWPIPPSPLWGCHSTKRLSAALRPLARVTNPNSGASRWHECHTGRSGSFHTKHLRYSALGYRLHPGHFLWKACSWCSWSEWDSWDHRWKLHPRPCQEGIQEHSRYDDPPRKDEFREPSQSGEDERSAGNHCGSGSDGHRESGRQRREAHHGQPEPQRLHQRDGGLRAGGFGRLCCCGPAHTAFSLVPGTYPSYSLPRLTLDDLHYVLRKKLKNLAITILLSLVIWALPKMLLLNTQSLLSLFPNVANGCAVKLYLPSLPQITFCLPISFSIIDMLLSICCMLGRLMHNNALIFPYYGMTLFIWNGDPFFVCVPLLNILVLCLKILLFWSFRILLTLLMMTFAFSNIPFVIRIDNLAKASQRRQDCSGQKQPVDVVNTRAFYLSLHNPIHQSIMRHILTGSLDHTYRLYKFNLVASPVCPHCNVCEETAGHIFWHCSRWDSIRHEYSTLLRLFSLVGTQWPKCFLHCGWVELFMIMGFRYFLT